MPNLEALRSNAERPTLNIQRPINAECIVAALYERQTFLTPAVTDRRYRERQQDFKTGDAFEAI